MLNRNRKIREDPDASNGLGDDLQDTLLSFEESNRTKFLYNRLGIGIPASLSSD